MSLNDVQSEVGNTRAPEQRKQRISTRPAGAEGGVGMKEGMALKSNARKVYDHHDIGCNIFKLLDDSTLATLMRVEKAVTGDVSRLLYHTINGKMSSRMTKSHVSNMILRSAPHLNYS